MNNLLFYTALILIALYFFYYRTLPQSSKTSPLFTHSQTTRTENDTADLPGPEDVSLPALIRELEAQVQALKTDQRQKADEISAKQQIIAQMKEQNKDSAQQIRELKTQITKLQSEIRDLAKRPLKPTSSKSTQTDQLTPILDNLIKDIQALNSEL
jgi:hypothetical protein